MSGARPFDIALLISVVPWWIFFAYWLVSAVKVKRTVEREGAGSRLVVLLTAGLGAVLLFASIGNPAFRLQLLPRSLVTDVVGNVCSIAGICVLIWARRTIGRNWSGTITLKEDHELIQSGPYQYVRHPIYSGYFLMYLGTATVVGRAAGFVGFAMTIIGFWYKLSQEEALMTRHFGTRYTDYKSKVRAVIPWVL